MSWNLQPARAAEDARPDELKAAGELLCGGRGWTVRCTPGRRVVRIEASEGRVLFGKLRRRGLRAAIHEWDLLGELRGIGLLVCSPVGLWRQGSDSLLVTRQAPGRPVQALLADAMAAGDWRSVRTFLSERAAPQVRRLHSHGWFYRDLYWNHWFARTLDEDPTWIDVERAFRPWWRHQRWRLKDLAGLVSSAEPPLPATDLLRALRAYAGTEDSNDWIPHLMGRAHRVRHRRPKFG